MNTQQTQTAPARAQQEITDFERLLAKEGKAVQFVPFASSDPIRLTPKLVQEYIAVRTKTGKTCSERDAIRFVMLCQTQRLNPFAGDAYLIGYDSEKYGAVFSLIVAHSALLKRAEVADGYEGMESGVILEGDNGEISEREGDFKLKSEKVVGGWARVYRRSRKPTYKRLAIAQRMPRFQSDFWSEDKAPEQITKCAEADALRTTFPSLLGALYTEGEMSSAIDRLVPEAKTGNGRHGSPLVETVSAPARAIAPAQPAPEPASEPPEDASDGALGPQRSAQDRPASPEPASAPEQPSEGQLLKSKYRREFEAFCTANGFSFSDVQRWGEETGNIPDAGSISGFAEMPDAMESVCARLLKAKNGLKQGLAQVKGGGK